MKQTSITTTTFKLSLIGLAALAASCGGGSSGDGVSTATISGAIVAAPVAGAQVSVVDESGNTVVAAVTTDGSGKYSFNIPVDGLAQALIVKSSGGRFTDEATSLKRDAGDMSAYMPASSMSNGSSVSVTPGTTIIARLVMTHRKSIADAKTIFAEAFGYTPDVSIEPVDATETPTAGVSNEAKLAGLRAAAFSQLNRDLHLLVDQQFDMFKALADDLSDGVLDGVDVSGSAVSVGATGSVLPADIQNRFVMAMENFRDTTKGLDKTGLENNQIGNLPFARMALTTNYKIEYIQGMMAAMEGKTMFKLRITDKATGLVGQPGLTVTLMPMMHMADGMRHSTPNMNCVAASAGNGYYDCTTYYLMAGGMSMGYWTLMVTATDTGAGTSESVTFYPKVMMTTGDTPKIILRGLMGAGGDVIMDMTGEAGRKYYVFKESLSGTTGAHDFTMFIAAMESMMSYPAVSGGTVLNDSTVPNPPYNPAYELPVTTMTVEVSTTPTDAASWVPATDNGNGKWVAISVAGLVGGTTGTIYVRLTIDGQQKTTDGMTPAGDGTNDYGMFTVTPPGEK